MSEDQQSAKSSNRIVLDEILFADLYPRDIHSRVFARFLLSPVGGNSKTFSEKKKCFPLSLGLPKRELNLVRMNRLSRAFDRGCRQIGHEEEQREKRREERRNEEVVVILLDEATSVSDCRDNR